MTLVTLKISGTACRLQLRNSAQDLQLYVLVFKRQKTTWRLHRLHSLRYVKDLTGRGAMAAENSL